MAMPGNRNLLEAKKTCRIVFLPGRQFRHLLSTMPKKSSIKATFQALYPAMLTQCLLGVEGENNVVFVGLKGRLIGIVEGSYDQPRWGANTGDVYGWR